MKYPQKYGKQGNLSTYCSDTTTPYTTRSLWTKKGDLGIANNYRGIALISIAAKIYNAPLLNHIEPKIEKNSKEKRKWLSEKLTHGITNCNNPSNIRCSRKKPRGDTIICRLLRGKMGQILLAYSLPKDTVAAKTEQYKNMKLKVRSPDGDFFDIFAGVLQGGILAPYLLIISLDYVLRTSMDLIKENIFSLAKAGSNIYPAWTIMDADYADDITLHKR